MKQSKFAKKRLAVYISAALIAGLNTNVMAEEAALTETKDKEVEVIEVTGIMSSLTRSMLVKRNTSGVVDVISAEDMGNFPTPI